MRRWDGELEVGLWLGEVVGVGMSLWRDGIFDPYRMNLRMGNHNQMSCTHLEISPPLCIIPCILLDRLCELEDSPSSPSWCRSGIGIGGGGGSVGCGV
jgi:hypothetical protein